VKTRGWNAKQKRTGWHKQRSVLRGGTFEPEAPYVPSAWDLLLRELKLNDAVALVIAEADPRGKSDAKAAALRAFAKGQRFRKYVPEAILAAFGLEVVDTDLADKGLL
jgi:hypothetical protein